MKRLSIAVVLLVLLSAGVFAIDIPMSDSARLDIVSRTSFGINLDKPYQYGLNNELTQMDLVFGLAPYQKISNRLGTDKATGFINVTLFNLDLIKVFKKTGYNAPSTIGTNRYQTGEFIAGIVKGPWLIQLNAEGNEPFSSPWNKGLQFVNDGFKLSWAYLDTMVDIRRVKSITGVPVVTHRGEENMIGDGDILDLGAEATMKQFGFDAVGNIADRFGTAEGGEMVAVMYNTDNFGINLKLGTELNFEDPNITASDRNGLAAGIDSVITPSAVPGLKIFASLMTTRDYGTDKDSDPLFGGTRVGYTIPLNEEISVEPWAGLDIGTNFKNDGGTEKPGYEASFGMTMRWPGQSGWLTDYILNSDGRVFPGMSLGYKIYENKETQLGPEHSIKLTLFEPKGDEGLFYGLGSEVIVDLINMTGAKGIPQDNTGRDPAWEGFSVLATAYFDYELNNLGKLPGTLRPWTILYYDNLPGAAISSTDDRVNDMKVDLGINLENAIANTTFGFVWNTGSLIQNKKYGALRIIAEIRL